MTGRRQHYAHFHGLLPLSSPLERDGRPLVLVHGNCQAESLRVLLAGDGSTPVRTVRVPPVHELTHEDLPRLQRVLDEVDVIVSQPVREGYRDLPLGTADLLARAPRRPRLVVVPVLRWAALHPFQVIVRSPAAGEPPLVPYHDLRTLTVAAGRPELPEVPSARAVRAVRDLSARELRARQERHDALPVVDLFEAAGAEATHTVNHPGNAVLRGLAGRVLAALGLPADVPDPGRTLLDSVHAPVLPAVLDALGLPGPGRADWLVHGEVTTDADVRAAHLRWYAEHPGVAQAGLARHAEAAAELAA
ncbi:WcbI family polysaccharide biosynthesis putative acetyltransferase [Kineococcus sp. LSe6-4]|uniref:WcbI family polysaccharide biosynthesis putative acetyltransferase n=1 Tax=Kineococcus halophytocola TaxID=3234027 RepID=A0ABV4H524_9ACTN